MNPQTTQITRINKTKLEKENERLGAGRAAIEIEAGRKEHALFLPNLWRSLRIAQALAGEDVRAARSFAGKMPAFPGCAPRTTAVRTAHCTLLTTPCTQHPTPYPLISSAATSLAPKIFRSTSSIARASTDIERLIDSSYSKSPTID
jgi:hypothetical protein